MAISRQKKGSKIPRAGNVSSSNQEAVLLSATSRSTWIGRPERGFAVKEVGSKMTVEEVTQLKDQSIPAFSTFLRNTHAWTAFNDIVLCSGLWGPLKSVHNGRNCPCLSFSRDLTSRLERFLSL